jgi:hypothetical protein
MSAATPKPLPNNKSPERIINGGAATSLIVLIQRSPTTLPHTGNYSAALN